MMFVWAVFVLLRRLLVGVTRINKRASVFWKMLKTASNSISKNDSFYTKAENNVFIMVNKGDFR